MSIGATTASTGAFTTLSATGVATFSAGSAAAPAITTTGDTNTGIFFPAADTIAFSEGGAEAMRIDSSGNLGLGVTPSAWQTTSGSRAIQFLGSSLYGYRDTNLILAQNAYFDGSWRYYASSIASGYYTIGSGAHSWYTAPSGTAGNAISFTQAMTLNASGNLGIGTSSPATALHIADTTQPKITIEDTTNTSFGRITGGGSTGSLTLEADYTNTKAGTIMAFNVDNTERMRIDSSGNVGIGRVRLQTNYQ
jgi:hypothetical protein